ncbi:MAG: TfoX/Sxy family protein [Proteobacteria bacterium]|nr:TfoX/Sxy family protein [Pseudomonadota bacterium]
MAYDPATAERVRHLLADRHDVHERKMMGSLAFMAKGGMCCAVSGRGGLLVRIVPETQPRLIARPHVRPMVMAGRPVSSFVRVMPEGYRTHAALRKWVQCGLDAVAALKTRPTPRRPPRRPRASAAARKTLAG